MFSGSGSGPVRSIRLRFPGLPIRALPVRVWFAWSGPIWPADLSRSGQLVAENLVADLVDWLADLVAVGCCRCHMAQSAPLLAQDLEVLKSAMLAFWLLAKLWS